MKQLILGGARSGKSRFGETQALACGEKWVYIATAQAKDGEMLTRIEQHQADRDPKWVLVEESRQLGAVLDRYNQSEVSVLVDCLTLWLSNCLLNDCWDAERSVFLEAVAHFEGHIALVSNEVGSGVVPLGELSRQFVDESGRLHQELGALCERVTLVVAGLPLTLK